jgi:hypothetical protein
MEFGHFDAMAANAFTTRVAAETKASLKGVQKLKIEGEMTTEGGKAARTICGGALFLRRRRRIL